MYNKKTYQNRYQTLGHQPIMQIVLREKLGIFQRPTFPGEDRDLYATLLLTPKELFRNNLRGKNT